MITEGVALGTKLFLFLKQITLQHGKKAFLPENQIVQDLDTQNFTGLPEPTCYILVFHAWLEVSTGMVMGDYDGGGSLSHCFGKDFTCSMYFYCSFQMSKLKMKCLFPANPQKRILSFFGGFGVVVCDDLLC